jgi:hypothetical protein
LGQLDRVALDELGEFEEDLGALAGTEVAPAPVLERLARRRDRGVDVLDPAFRDLGERLPGRRVDHLEGLAGHRFDPLAADHEPRRLDELGYLGKYVYLGHAALLKGSRFVRA